MDGIGIISHEAIREDVNMRRLKTIDELYEEVKDFGLVITNDAPLETAINARIRTAKIGKLAYTPRHIAMELGPAILGRPFMSEMELIAAVSKETGLGLRHVYSEILNIRDIRTHTADVRAYINTKNARRIYESYRRMPTLERAMSEFEPDDKRVSWFYEIPGGVAIVGVELFDDLDKHVVPNHIDVEFVDIFSDDEFRIDTIYEVGNDRQLAENAADIVANGDPEDFAIVLNAGGAIADAVRAALYRRGIPFINSLNVKDLAQIRDYISFLSLSMSFNTLRVKDVKELFSNYNGFFKRNREEYLLHRQTEDDMRDRAFELWTTMRDIFEKGMTFNDVKNSVCDASARPQVGLLLEELQMSDVIVTPDRLSEIRFAVENIQNLKHNEQIPDNERKGVLLTDSKNSVFVDRPVMIYLGMEQEWNVPVVGKRYLDPETEAEKNAIRLQALLQQGQRRIYCVNSFKNGGPARPCSTFDLMDGGGSSSFSDLAESLVRGRWATSSEEFIPDKGLLELDNSKEFDEEFSKSSFNAYVACPRKYMFNFLLPSPDKDTSEFGNLIHEFAELYVCYPEVVRERGVDSFVNMISDRYAGLSTPLMEDLDSKRIRMAMVNTMRYIDLLDPVAELNVSNKAKPNPNRFMLQLGLEMTSDICEVDHHSAGHPIHGYFDLHHNGAIIDYKTGRKKTPKDIVSGMSMDQIARYPEFQPIIYLALAGDLEDPATTFYQFYATENDVISVSEDYDIRNNVRTIVLSSADREAFMRSEEAVRMLESSLKKDAKPYARGILGILDDRMPSDPDSWSEDDDAIDRVLAVMGKKSGKTNRDLASHSLRKLADLATDRMPSIGSEVVILPDTFRSFLEQLDALHDTAMGQAYTGYPAEPRGAVDCADCQYYQACMSIPAKNDSGEGGGHDE